MRTNINRWWIAGIAMFAFGGPAIGQVDCNAGAYEDRLKHRYKTDKCVKENKALAQKVASATKPFGDFKGAESEPYWMSRGHDALVSYAAILAASRAQASADGNAELVGILDALRAFLDRATGELTADMTLAKLGLPETDTRVIELGMKFWDPVGLAPPARHIVGPLQSRDCLDAETSTEACDEAFATATAAGDHVYAIASIISNMRLPLRVEVLKVATARTKRWEAYLYDTEFQFWWELGLNRYLESKCPKGPTGAVAKLLSRMDQCQKNKADAFGNELGFREAPSIKAIFLHPDVGVMYLESEADGERFKPAIVTQVFGYEWWEWKETEVANRRRVSIVGVVADTVATKSFGYGLQLGWGDYALAITKHGDDVALTLNVGLIGKVSTVNSKWAEELKKVAPE